jgi:dihydroorotate dehydrogenase electron transfer subunit
MPTVQIKKQHKVEIVENIAISDNMYKLVICAPDIAKNASPGQFVSVLCDDLVLRRPFSIAGIEGNNIVLIYALKGQGTGYMAELNKGDNLDILGPLGKGFNITNQKALLLGAGVGIAPMLCLSQKLENNGTPFHFLSGFRKNISMSELNTPYSQIITDDGSSGFEGKVNDYLASTIRQYGIEKIYTCGPIPVMSYAVEMAKEYNIDIEVAMEKKFACGIGVCMGCSIEINKNGQIVNQRICKDGPVFDGKAIVW